MDNCTTPLKRCLKCGNEYPLTPEFFYRTKRSKSGFHAQCKTCSNEATSKWHKDNPDKTKAAQLRYDINHPGERRNISKRWRQNNPEKVKEHARRDRQLHHERTRENLKRWRQNNPERYRENNAKWRRNNPEKVGRWQKEHPENGRVKTSRYRARKRSLSDTLTPNQWVRCVEYFHGCCAVCGRQANDLFDTHTLAADHWIPLFSPDCPGTVVTNIVPLCHGVGGCNNSKSATNPIKWLKQSYPKTWRRIFAKIEAYFQWVREQDGK